VWFKVFVVFRFPVSVIFLFGYGVALGMQPANLLEDRPYIGYLFVALMLGACIFPVVASLKLVRGRGSALWLAWWLLGLETAGALLLVSVADDIGGGGIDLLTKFTAACDVIVVWTLPNALVFNKARGKFTEASESKPPTPEK
jgi:hypothetical protein